MAARGEGARGGLIAAAVAFVLLVGGLAWGIRRAAQHAKFDLNGARVRSVAKLLALDTPASVDGATVRDLLRRHAIPADEAVDAWNRPILVQGGVGPDGARHYAVISYGRDGRPGPCSVARQCTSLDADWILRDEVWRDE
jgi:hypothetical protein